MSIMNAIHSWRTRGRPPGSRNRPKDVPQLGEHFVDVHYVVRYREVGRRECGPPSSSISVRHRATRIVAPHAVCIIEPGGIANRSGISVRRVNADTESKTGAIISSAAVIPATAVIGTTTAIGIPAIEVSACRR